jgi:hypothetical protein
MDVKLNLADPNLLQAPSAPQTLAEKALRVPPEMVLQIASGLDEPADIAHRYGFTPEEFASLQSWTPFVQEVAKCRAEIEKSGFDFVLDARLKAKELSNVIFLRAMSTDATFGQVHDAFRTFTEFGDLKPKPPQNPTTPGGPSSGFSINIVLNSDPRSQRDPNSKTTIDVTPVEEPLREVIGTRNPFSINIDTPTSNTPE